MPAVKRKLAGRRKTEDVIIHADKIEIVPIENLKLWARNKRFNEIAVPEVMEAIRQYGCRSPLNVWRRNNVVYKGNTTLKALQRLGSPVAPVIWHDFKDIDEAEQYGISDNKRGEYSQWDEDALAEVMFTYKKKGLDDATISLLTGFKEPELRGLKLEANLERLKNIKEENTGIKSLIKVHCEPWDKESLMKDIFEYLDELGYKQIEVK